MAKYPSAFKIKRRQLRSRLDIKQTELEDPEKQCHLCSKILKEEQSRSHEDGARLLV